MKTQYVFLLKNFFRAAVWAPGIAGVVLLGVDGIGLRCAAQGYFPPAPSPPNGANDRNPADYQTDETTFSIGVVQIQISPNFTNLFFPTNVGGTFYPGFSPSSGILTTPVMYDSSTTIGTSKCYEWGVAGGLPAAYPVEVGSPTFQSSYGNLSPASAGDYYGIPYALDQPLYQLTGWSNVLTQIEMFDLACSTSEFSCVTNDSRVPPAGVDLDVVTAGPESGGGQFGLGGFANTVANKPRRSIGMVEQQASGAAASFFNIYVQVNLPSVPGTVTDIEFPGSTGNQTPGPYWNPGTYPYTEYPAGLMWPAGFGLAQLTNDFSDPLLITNLSVSNLPPGVVYIHGETTAVPLLFAYNNPPFWNAGDTLGWIALAGHGVFTNCSSSTDGNGTNCCAQLAASGYVNGFLDDVLGTTNNPPTPAVPAFTQTSSLFPTPNTTYISLVNTVPTSSTTSNVLDSQLVFSNGLALADLVLGPWSKSNSIALPAAHSVSTYNATNVPISFNAMFFGVPYASLGTGFVSMTISNTASPSSTLFYTNPPPRTNYILQLTGANFRADNADIGPTFLEVNPNVASLGQHTVQASGTNWMVSSYINLNLMAGSDGHTYSGSSNSLTVFPGLPAATYKPTTVVVQTVNPSNLVVKWAGSVAGALEATTNLVTGPWVVLSGTNTVTAGSLQVPIGTVAKAQFYRVALVP
jgi:hypothetical protein